MSPDPPWGANPYRLDSREREKQANDQAEANSNGFCCNHHKTNGFLEVPPAQQTRQDRERFDYEMHQKRLIRENKAYVDENLRRMMEMTEKRRREGEAVAAAASAGAGGDGTRDVQGQGQGEVDEVGDNNELEEEDTRWADQDDWRHTNW